MKIRHYVMRGTQVFPASLMTWASDYEKTDRRIRQEYIGRFWVSTVFLGLDHQFEDGPPLIFETMVFSRGWDEDEMRRYSTYSEAVRGHEAIIARLRREVPWWSQWWWNVRRKFNVHDRRQK